LPRRARVILALIVGIICATSTAAAAAPATIQYNRVISGDRVTLAPGQLSTTWTASTVQPQAPFTRLVASWNAETPAAGRITIEAQVTTTSGETSGWYTLGVWAADDSNVQRTSVDAQADAIGRVATDTLYARAAPFMAYTLRAQLDRASTEDPSPVVRSLGAAVSSYNYAAGTPTSMPTSPQAVELSIPPLSQEIHAKQYPQWGGGGEAWCSPTSTEMVVEFWGRGPSAQDLTWVDPTYADPSVDFAARSTFDAAYHGTGNWPFNAAYAARFGLDTFVTQLRSLAEAEQFVRAGIPLVASIASQPGELDGFLFSGGTNGHLVVIAGFTAAGDPIVYDPAAWSDASVRRVYDRAQFERVWLRGSGGTVYVIHPADVPLPAVPTDATPNW
jgi:hypothetical protein